MKTGNNLDFIGDIHGNSQKLLKLLELLGYVNSQQGWIHPEGRKIVVLGDFINVGSDSKQVLRVLYEMWEKGLAIILIGNHEYHLAWNYYKYGAKIFEMDGPLQKDYQYFYTEFINDKDLLYKYIEWLIKLSLFIENDDYRAVHAYWEKRNMKILSQYNNLEEIFLAFEKIKKKKANELKKAINETITGLQLVLNPSCQNKSVLKFRIKWWIPVYGKLLPECIVVHKSVQCPGITVNSFLLPDFIQYDTFEKPVFFGHYWLQRLPYLISSNICCLDFGAAKGGYLVAYRWNGERVLIEGQMVVV